MNILLIEIYPLTIIKHIHNYFTSRMFVNIVFNSKNLRQSKRPQIIFRLDNFTAFNDIIFTYLKNIMGITIEMKVLIIQSWGQKQF